MRHARIYNPPALVHFIFSQVLMQACCAFSARLLISHSGAKGCQQYAMRSWSELIQGISSRLESVTFWVSRFSLSMYSKEPPPKATRQRMSRKRYMQPRANRPPSNSCMLAHVKTPNSISYVWAFHCCTIAIITATPPPPLSSHNFLNSFCSLDFKLFQVSFRYALLWLRWYLQGKSNDNDTELARQATHLKAPPGTQGLHAWCQRTKAPDLGQLVDMVNVAPPVVLFALFSFFTCQLHIILLPFWLWSGLCACRHACRWCA